MCVMLTRKDLAKGAGSPPSGGALRMAPKRLYDRSRPASNRGMAPAWTGVGVAKPSSATI